MTTKKLEIEKLINNAANSQLNIPQSSQSKCGIKKDCMATIASNLGEVEGNTQSVINPQKGNSGPTIGVGVDLWSGITANDLEQIDISDETRSGLKDIIKEKGKKTTKDTVAEYGSKIFYKDDISKLSEWRLKKTVDEARKDFDAAVDKNNPNGKHFDDLSCEQQSVIASIKHQYGSFKKGTPNQELLDLASQGKWDDVIENLLAREKNPVLFESGKYPYADRRKKEASWLRKKEEDRAWLEKNPYWNYGDDPRKFPDKMTIDPDNVRNDKKSIEV